jgi:hypothetical protein
MIFPVEIRHRLIYEMEQFMIRCVLGYPYYIRRYCVYYIR